MTKHEATLVTEKQKKRQMHFPQRKYAVKVRFMSPCTSWSGKVTSAASGLGGFMKVGS